MCVCKEICLTCSPSKNSPSPQIKFVDAHVSSGMPSGCHSPQTEWLKQQKCVFSQFCRLDVWDQGITGVSCPLGCRWLSFPCVLAGSVFCVSVWILISSLYKDTSCIGLRVTLMTILTQVPLQRPYLQIQSFCEVLGARTLPHELLCGWGHSLAHNMCFTRAFLVAIR